MGPSPPLPGTPPDHLAFQYTSSPIWIEEPCWSDRGAISPNSIVRKSPSNFPSSPNSLGQGFFKFNTDDFVSDSNQINNYLDQHEGPARGTDFEPSYVPIALPRNTCNTDPPFHPHFVDKTDSLGYLHPFPHKLKKPLRLKSMPRLIVPRESAGWVLKGNVYDGTSITTSNHFVPSTSHDGTSVTMSNSFVRTDLVLSSTSHHEPPSTSLEGILHDQSSKPRDIPLQYLKKITNNFSDERILGQGGSGVVYKGVLPNGEMIAVKKIVSSLMPGLQKQFENEVCHLMMLRHPNIVRCVGYCYETRKECLEYNGKLVFAEMAERLLCLEYIPNRSLDNYIKDESSILDWSTRYKIIEGICYGLCHLHRENGKPILHLDLKPANILLGDGMVPKITDFGLSRLLDQEKTIYTKSRDGTLGYMAPEFLHGGTITPKSDIFSLGVIIIEVVTGHRDYPDVTRVSSDGFIKLVLDKWRNVLEKSSWFGSVERECQQIERCIQVGLICVNHDRTKRPPIAKIISMLQGLERINRVASS